MQAGGACSLVGGGRVSSVSEIAVPSFLISLCVDISSGKLCGGATFLSLEGVMEVEVGALLGEQSQLPMVWVSCCRNCWAQLLMRDYWACLVLEACK